MFCYIEDTKIHFEYSYAKTFADAEVIVLIHGMGLDLTSWDEITPLLTPKYHVLRYDLRGHGTSNLGLEKINPSLLCDDLDHLLSTLGVDKFHLIGHGFGGFLAMKYALRKPQLIQTLTLISTPLYYPETLCEDLLTFRRRFSESGSILPMANTLIKQICYTLTEEKMDFLMLAYSKTSIGTYFLFFEMIADVIKNASFLNQIEQLDIPTLFITGEFDIIYPLHLYSVGTLYFNKYRLRVVPNAANAVQIDQPDIVSEWINQFISQNKQEMNEGSPSSFSRATEVYKLLFEQGVQKLDSANKLTVNLLNGFHVELNGEILKGHWNRRQAKDLLCYLIFHPSVTREQLYDLYWPELELNKAKNNLRVSLNHLKQIFSNSSLQTEILMTDREHIQLRSIIQCDVISFWEQIQHATDETDELTKLSFIEKILSQVRGCLIPGFYSDWMLRFRSRLEDSLVSLALWAKDTYISKNDYKNALRHIEYALLLHPNDEVLEALRFDYMSQIRTGTCS